MGRRRRFPAWLAIGVSAASATATATACGRLPEAPSSLRAKADASFSFGLRHAERAQAREASRYLFRALAAYRDTGDTEGEARALAALGRVRLQEGRYELASRFFERALSITTEGETRARAMASYGEALAALGRDDAAIAALETALRRGRVGFQVPARLWLVLARAQRAEGRFGHALEAVERARALERSAVAHRLRADVLFDLGEIERAFEASEKVSLAVVQRLIQPQARALVYALGEERSLLWDVTPSRLRAHVLPPRSVLEPLALSFRAELASGTRHGARDRLAEALLRDVRLSNEEQVVVVSGGALASMPFGALATADDALLLSRVEIVRLSSLAELEALRARSGRSYSGWVAVAADPSYGLSGARREARAIARLAPPGSVEVVQGSEASTDVVLGDAFRPFRMLHLATHGSPGRGLVLGDAVVGRAELARRELHAETVVLSACASDLADAFLESGARRVIASHWEVDDEATTALMTLFYEALFSGATPGAALREAQLTLRADARFRAPRYWAGFELHGDWGL